MRIAAEVWIFVHALQTSLAPWAWIGQLLARVSVGLLFFLSGRGKLFVPARRDQMRETIRQAGLSRPEVTAVAISIVEFASGAMLVVGALTPLACLMLTGVMAGALTTTQIRRIEARSPLEWIGEFLYLPEVLYIVILVWLLLAGPGALSVDRLFAGDR